MSSGGDTYRAILSIMGSPDDPELTVPTVRPKQIFKNEEWGMDDIPPSHGEWIPWSERSHKKMESDLGNTIRFAQRAFMYLYEAMKPVPVSWLAYRASMDYAALNSLATQESLEFAVSQARSMGYTDEDLALRIGRMVDTSHDKVRKDLMLDAFSLAFRHLAVDSVEGTGRNMPAVPLAHGARPYGEALDCTVLWHARHEIATYIYRHLADFFWSHEDPEEAQHVMQPYTLSYRKGSIREDISAEWIGRGVKATKLDITVFEYATAGILRRIEDNDIKLYAKWDRLDEKIAWKGRPGAVGLKVHIDEYADGSMRTHTHMDIQGRTQDVD